MKTILRITLFLMVGNLFAQTGLHVKWVDETSVIYYDRSGTVWIQDINSGQRKEISKGSQPAPNPVNKDLFAFRTKINGQSGIIIKELSSNTVTRVSGPELEGLKAFHPIWSFDGNLLAFNAESPSNRTSNLFVYDYRSGNLSKHLTEHFVGAPAFFSNGDILIAIKNEKGTSLIKYDLKSGESNTLLTSDHKIFFADASHDGKKIAYTHDGFGNREIMILDLQTGKNERLSQTPYDEFSPRWSASGDHLIYFANLDGKYPAFLMDMKSGEVKNITP